MLLFSTRFFCQESMSFKPVSCCSIRTERQDSDVVMGIAVLFGFFFAEVLVNNDFDADFRMIEW